MNIIQKIVNSLTAPAIARKRRPRLSGSIIPQASGRVRMEMDRLIAAAENAVDPNNPDRLDLLLIYENAWKDDQVIAEREKAESYLITEPFEVTPKTSEVVDKPRTDLFRRPWFDDFLKESLYAEFWGYSLLEFGEMDEQGEFTDVSTFPRLHVKPYSKQIVVTPTDSSGVSYDGLEKEYFLLPIGTPANLGKLESISREVIWKTFARADWSEYLERFGKPFINYETDTTNEEELNEAAKMATQFGRDLFAITSSGEKLEVTQLESKGNSDAYKLMADTCDEKIAKMMNGQTGTSDEKAWVGSAEVHERVMSEFNKRRMRRIQNIINYKLFPFLIHWGYQLEGYEFKFHCLKDPEENTIDNSRYDKPDTVENRFADFFE